MNSFDSAISWRRLRWAIKSVVEEERLSQTNEKDVVKG